MVIGFLFVARVQHCSIQLQIGEDGPGGDEEEEQSDGGSPAPRNQQTRNKFTKLREVESESSRTRIIRGTPI